VERARRALAEAPEADGDCRSVQVWVEDESARVELTTRDGRHAVRPLTRPNDLLPTVSALMVTVQSEAEPRPAAAEPSRPDSEQKVSAATSTSASHLIVTALGGARLAAPGAWFSPTLSAGVALVSGGWEAGLTGAWVPAAVPLAAAAPAGFRSSAWSLALSGGLRAGSGSVVWLAGAHLGVALVHEQVSTDDVMMEGEVTDEQVDTNTVSVNPIEVRLGVHAGFAFPRHARLRLRPQLSLGGAPMRLADRLASDSPLPALPSWSGELALGVEGDVL
jgi:hypothetical protein